MEEEASPREPNPLTSDARFDGAVPGDGVRRGAGVLSVVIAVVQKELRDFLRNRTLLISIFAPILVGALFVNLVDRPPLVRVAMVAGSDSRVHAALSMSGAFTVRDVQSADAANEAVTAGKVDLAVLLGDDFAARLGSATPPSVTLVVRQDAGPRTATAVTVLNEMLRTRAGQASPVTVSIRAVGRDERLVSRANLLLVFVVFILLIAFRMVAISVAEERDQQTMLAVMVTGVSPAGFLAGKALTVWALCGCGALVMIALCHLLASPVGGLLAMMAVGAGFSVSLGLWLGLLFRNLPAANAGVEIVFLALFVPAFLEDPLGWTWSAVLPGHVLMQGLRLTLVEGSGLGAVWQCIWPLVGYAALCMGAAYRAWRRR